MRKEENFTKDLSSIFDEAYDVDSTPMQDSLQSEEERYTDFKLYSEGGLKKIQTCQDNRTNRLVAMATPKETSEKQKIEAFLREAKLNAALQHPNIVPVYDIGMNGETPWFTMKFIKGHSLEEVIQDLKSGKLGTLTDLNERLDAFLKICEAIAYSHSLGILHLDLKPDNIRISDFGDVVVCDWGLADVVSSRCDESLLEYCSLVEYDLSMMTVDGVVKGTLGYMAPEQTTKTDMRKGPHTDIFSLGALLYTLLCNERAFKGDKFEEVIDKTARCEFQKPSALNPDVPHSLEAVCLKAMSLKIEDRYSSVEELKKEIQAYRNGFATEAENASLLKSLKLLYLRHKSVSIISMLTLTLFIVLSIVSLNHLNLTKENALQLAEKLSLEAEYHRKVNKDAAPLFLERAEASYKGNYLNDALNFCNSAVELDETIKEAWELKGKIHFVRAEFKEALQAFRKINSKLYFRGIAQQYAGAHEDGKQFPVKDYVSIMDQVHAKRDFDMFGSMTHFMCYSDISLDDRITFVKGVVTLRHRQRMKNKELNFSFNRETGHLDLSNNRWLNTILCLQNFPAKSVDLSNTGINNGIGLRAQTLEKLDISSTEIIELQTLECSGLKELNIANCGIPNLAPIYSFPLEKIDIRNTGLRSLLFTERFKHMKEIVINKDQFSERELSKVPDHVKVIIHE
ncbi:MAG: protein kinase [Lentisphaeraceae bacterium]|nr:protein kinase [Lentisphaeraceae bacterium]